MNEQNNPFENKDNEIPVPAEEENVTPEIGELTESVETSVEENTGNEITEALPAAEITEESTEEEITEETAITVSQTAVEVTDEGKNASKPKNKKKKRILDVLLVFCLIGFFVSGYFLLSDIIPRFQNMKNIQDIQQVSPIIDTESDTTKIPSIEYLKEINKDIIGWINIPNTNVDFPVLQCSNNNYYLQYSYNEKWNDAGSIFVDYRNSDDFTDQNTVIYGHARYDGTMFAQVLNYKKQAQYKKAPFITIVTEGKVYYYQVFSANIVPADYDYRQADYGSSFMSHIKEMRKNSMIKSSAEVTKDSKIITLSTCTNVIEDGRLALLAVLLNPDGEKIDLSQYPL